MRGSTTTFAKFIGKRSIGERRYTGRCVPIGQRGVNGRRFGTGPVAGCLHRFQAFVRRSSSFSTLLVVFLVWVFSASLTRLILGIGIIGILLWIAVGSDLLQEGSDVRERMRGRD